MRRYQREKNEFQTVKSIREQIESIRLLLAEKVTPKLVDEADTIQFLYAAHNAQRKHLQKEKISKKGRRSKFSRDALVRFAPEITSLLSGVSNGKISLARFVTAYLPVLNYPPDVQRALDDDLINLEEARSLARINRTNLPSDVKRKPFEIRRELLESHLKRFGTQSELERRVKEKLRLGSAKEAEQMTLSVGIMDKRSLKLLKLDEHDTQHLLWESIKNLVYSSREIDFAGVSDDAVKEILADLDQLETKLNKLKPKKVISVKFA